MREGKGEVRMKEGKGMGKGHYPSMVLGKSLFSSKTRYLLGAPRTSGGSCKCLTLLT